MPSHDEKSGLLRTRTVTLVLVTLAVFATPAAASNLSLCIKASDKAAATRYAAARAACNAETAANARQLPKRALAAANKSCLQKAQTAKSRESASGSTACKRLHPAGSSSANNTATFCKLTKAWLAAEEAGLASPNFDLAWVHATTDPLLAMFEIAPASVRADVAFIATSVYNSRSNAVDVQDAQRESEAKYAEAFTRLVGSVDEGIASAGFPDRIRRLSEFTKANCGIDLEATLKALQEKYLGADTPN